MKTDRPKSWDQFRGTYWLLGLALSISFVLYAFSWTSSATGFEEVVASAPEPDEIPIVRTKHEEPARLPPPKPTASAEPIDDTPSFVEEPLPDTLTTTIDIPEPVQPAAILRQPARPEAPKALPPERSDREEAPVIFAEVMPRFPGCEENNMTIDERKACAEAALMSFIHSQLRYPEMAAQVGIEGTVVIRFVVEKDGRISQAEIARDIGGGCGQAALEVVRKMPAWTPGRQQGRPVRVQFNLPVRFSLQKGF